MNRVAPLSHLVTYAQKCKDNALQVSAASQIYVYNMRAWNRTGSAINVGLCRRLKAGVDRYKIFTKISTAYANVTAAIEAGTATQIVTATNSDGFIVQSDRRIGMIGLTVSNTATGGTYTFEYYNGTAWTTLTTLENWTNFNSTGDKYIAFLPPHDWAQGDGAATAIDQNKYSIRVLHTTAPADTGSVNAIWIAEFLDYWEGLGDNNCAELMFDSERPFMLEGGEGLLPYFSTTNAINQFGAFYSVG